MSELVPVYSQKLQTLIQEANTALKEYGKWKGEAKSKILEAYRQALSDGYTPPAAKTLLESKLEYSERYIRECLPSDAKNENMVRLKKPANSGTVPQNSQKNKEEVVNITTKHNVIENPYEDSQDKLNDLIKETQDKQLKPISVESATERAKRLMQETGYDIDENEDQQIQINDLNTRIQMLEENEKRKSIALDKAHERNKEQQEEINRLQIQLEKATKTSPLDIPPQTPHVCNTEMKAKTKIQLYLSNELMLSFFKRHGVEHARDIPNMTIYGEVTNYMKDDDLAIGKIGTIRSAI